MTIEVETKYQPYQRLWMLDDGIIKEVVPTAVSFHGDKRGANPDYWKGKGASITYNIDNAWIDERKLFSTKFELLESLSKNAVEIKV